MKSTEDQLRDAFQAAAGSVEPGTLRRFRAPRRRLVWKVAAPLVAAVCVVLVIGVVVALPGRMTQRQERPVAPLVPLVVARPTGAEPKFIVSMITSPERGGTSLPKDQAAPTRVEVRSATTGRVIARVARPVEVAAWSTVAAADDNRLFFLSGFGPSRTVGQRSVASFYLYRLQLDGRGTPGALVPIPAAGAAPAGAVPQIAVSPDGTRLAFASLGLGAPNIQVTVLDLRIGRARTWVVNGVFPSMVAWMHDGRHLLVAGEGYGTNITERSWITDPFQSGSNLLTGATSLPRTIGGFPSPDGRTLYALRVGGAALDRKSIVRMSMADGRVLETLTRWTDGGGGPFTLDGSGQDILFMSHGQLMKINVFKWKVSPLQVRSEGGGGKSDLGVEVAW